MQSRLCLLAADLKLHALQTAEWRRSRCCWFINTTQEQLMISAPFVLANYEGVKSPSIDSYDNSWEICLLRYLWTTETRSGRSVGPWTNTDSSVWARCWWCHSFRSQWSAQLHKGLHTVLLSTENKLTVSHSGHWGECVTLCQIKTSARNIFSNRVMNMINLLPGTYK